MPELTNEELQKLIDDRARKIADDVWHIHKADAAGSPPPLPAASKEPPSEPPHLMRSWEKTCPDCGTKNPGFKEPNLYCAEPDCGVPVGNLPEGVTVAAGEQREIEHKPCWNCGSERFKVKQ